jgi:hypothetical protein
MVPASPAEFEYQTLQEPVPTGTGSLGPYSIKNMGQNVPVAVNVWPPVVYVTVYVSPLVG